MGVFDTIKVEHDCPSCGSLLPDYQSKSLDGDDVYTLGSGMPSEIKYFRLGEGYQIEVHDVCPHCATYIHGQGVVKDGVLERVIEEGYEKEGFYLNVLAVPLLERFFRTNIQIVPAFLRKKKNVRVVASLEAAL